MTTYDDYKLSHPPEWEDDRNTCKYCNEVIPEELEYCDEDCKENYEILLEFLLQDDKLYPVNFNGKDYYEKDCDDVFLAFYHCKYSLNDLGGVYLSDGTWIYPDGSMSDD